jgi:hypothetical protein
MNYEWINWIINVKKWFDILIGSLYYTRSGVIWSWRVPC